MKILVVDDIQETRDVLESLLRASGFEVVSAVNGVEALRMLRADGCDMIITDILMPEMDGYQFCMEAKRDERLRHIPLVFYSGTYTDENEEAFAYQLGAAQFIRKPIATNQLVKIIQALTRESETQDGVPKDAPPIEEKEVLKRYSERLVRKLEHKMLDLEREVAERKRTEQALLEKEGELRETAGKYRDLVENINEVIFSTDARGVVTYVSPVIETLSGYAPAEVIGRSFSTFLHDEDAARLVQAFKRTLGGPVQPGDYRLLTRDGQVRWIRVSMQAVVEGDRVAGARGVVTDLTESKNLQNQLQQSQRMEAIGNLAGGIAHDFNNVATVIAGYIEILLAKQEPHSPDRSILEQIRKAGDHARELTRQLLVFSQKQIHRPEVLDLNRAVQETETLLRHLIGEHIELVLLLDPDVGRVKADHRYMEQVLATLAVNARDAMSQGGRLTLETSEVTLDEESAKQHPDATPGTYVVLAMADNGRGMDEETCRHIFEPFYGAKGEENRSGLGLSTVYGMVKQSGGHICVESEPWEGTCFRVFLPRVEEAGLDAGEERRARSPRRSWETVLLVEDDESVRTMVRDVLQRQGYRVLEARSPGEALLAAEQHTGLIHMMLTDVVMPRMSGPDLVERLASWHPEMKILYMSGYTDSTIVHQGLEDPETAFLQKPFTPETLLRKVRTVLDAARRASD